MKPHPFEQPHSPPDPSLRVAEDELEFLEECAEHLGAITGDPRFGSLAMTKFGQNILAADEDRHWLTRTQAYEVEDLRVRLGRVPYG